LLTPEFVELHINTLHLTLGAEEGILLALDVHLLLAQEGLLVLVLLLQPFKLHPHVFNLGTDAVDLVSLLTILKLDTLVI
jgi:hypothetical protein